MKNLFLTAWLIFALGLSGQSQSLSNTTWDVFDQMNVQAYSFHYGNDTVFISTDFISFEPLSIYQESNDTITLNDIPGAPFSCPGGITGYYTFLMVGDSLYFTLLSDACAGRESVLTTYDWARNTSGLDGKSLSEMIKLFPNPSYDGLFNIRINNSEMKFDKYTVCNIQGQQIKEQSISGNGMIEQSLDLSEFSSGTYLLTFFGKSGNKSYKILK